MSDRGGTERLCLDLWAEFSAAEKLSSLPEKVDIAVANKLLVRVIHEAQSGAPVFGDVA